MGELAKLLNDAIATDEDAIEAYDAARARLDDDEDKLTLARFRDDHRRHVLELVRAIEAAGAHAVDRKDLRHFVQTGKVLVGSLFGGDDAILRALRSNEEAPREAYERLNEHCELARDLRAVVDRALEDERRHCEWLERHFPVTPLGERVAFAE